MKNSFKNALNALALLGFMVLAWATKRDFPIEALKMEVAFNADSTGFLLTNLDSVDFNLGTARVDRKLIGSVDTTTAPVFFLTNVSIKAKETLTLPIDRFTGFRQTSGGTDTLSKNMTLQRFTYSVILSKGADGFFDHDF